MFPPRQQLRLHSCVLVVELSRNVSRRAYALPYLTGGGGGGSAQAQLPEGEHGEGFLASPCRLCLSQLLLQLAHGLQALLFRAIVHERGREEEQGGRRIQTGPHQ